MSRVRSASLSNAAWGLFLLVLAGCQTAPEQGRILSADIFEDIPAPATARVQTDKSVSFAYRSASFRCAKYVYRFEGEVDEAVAFFHDVMIKPPYSWDLRQETELPVGHARMDFRKGEEYCTVDIRTRESRAGQADVVTITICVNYQ